MLCVLPWQPMKCEKKKNTLNLKIYVAYNKNQKNNISCITVVQIFNGIIYNGIYCESTCARKKLIKCFCDTPAFPKENVTRRSD